MLTLLCGTLFRPIEWVSYPGMYQAWQFVLHHVFFKQRKLRLLGLLAGKLDISTLLPRPLCQWT
jgi:hypothetical protein